MIAVKVLLNWFLVVRDLKLLGLWPIPLGFKLDLGRVIDAGVEGTVLGLTL
jgi:hypothetical protein